MAIIASEIRIGNFISFPEIKDGKFGSYGIAHIIDSTENRIYTGYLYAWKNCENCNPIPLTEKWLLNLGFVDPSQGYRATGSEVVYEITAKEKKIELWMRWPDAWGFSNWNKCEIKYVHQLQNLFFVLTGEELQIKD